MIDIYRKNVALEKPPKVAKIAKLFFNICRCVVKGIWIVKKLIYGYSKVSIESWTQ